MAVFKVAKSGYDVRTAPVENLVFDPDNPPPKVSSHGADTIVCTWNGSVTSGSKTIAHNLGYVPFALVYIEESPGSNERYLLATMEPGVSVPFYYEINSTNLVITANGLGDFSGTYTFYYYIFLDELI